MTPKRLKDHVDFHREARAALERVREWGFVDVFRRHHPDEPKQYTFWDYRVRSALEYGLGWIDVEARRAERPSDHTFLVAEFALWSTR